jgi:hypothetical protein
MRNETSDGVLKIDDRTALFLNDFTSCCCSLANVDLVPCEYGCQTMALPSGGLIRPSSVLISLAGVALCVPRQKEMLGGKKRKCGYAARADTPTVRTDRQPDSELLKLVSTSNSPCDRME